MKRIRILICAGEASETEGEIHPGDGILVEHPRSELVCFDFRPGTEGKHQAETRAMVEAMKALRRVLG